MSSSSVIGFGPQKPWLEMSLQYCKQAYKRALFRLVLELVTSLFVLKVGTTLIEF